MKVKLTYFAVLREQRGLSHEEIETDCVTASDLYTDLKERHGFSLDSNLVTVALNGAFQPMETPLSDGDEVVFIPPVAGG